MPFDRASAISLALGGAEPAEGAFEVCLGLEVVDVAAIFV